MAQWFRPINMWIWFILAAPLLAWHTPVHRQITRAAFETLPAEMRQKWAAGSALLIERTPLSLLKDLMPPPPGRREIALHTVIERSAPEFTLAARPPRPLGAAVPEVAAAILERC